jgi:putative addiction module component (TIGR02574 family)
MSATEILEQIRNLPGEQRDKVLEQIRDEFDDELSPEQIEELERRADRVCRNPETGIPWEQICAELPERLKNRKCAAK